MGRTVTAAALLLGLLLSWGLMQSAQAQEVVSLEEQDLSAWETLWEEWFPEKSLEKFLESIIHGQMPDPGKLLQQAWEKAGDDWLRQAAAAAVQLLLLITLELFMLYLVQDSRAGIHNAALVIRAAAVLYLSGQLLALLQTTLQTLNRLSGFLNAAIPVLMPLLLASGWTATSGLLQPATLTLSVWMDQWLRPVLAQGVSLTMMLRMANTFSKQEPLEGIIHLGRRLVQWFMGLCLTGFVAIVGIQASAMLSYDSLALRSARYTMDSTIPGVGGFFADMLDTAVISAQIIRSSLGVASLLVLIAVCLEPVLRLLLCILTLDLAAALGDVLGESALGKLYRDVSALVRLLLYGLMASALLVLLVVSLACMAGVGM